MNVTLREILMNVFQKLGANSTFKMSSQNVKSKWNPPNGRLALEVFLSKLENKVLSVLAGTPYDYNLPKKEWLAMKGLAEDRNMNV